MTPGQLAELDGRLVQARALGFDGPVGDGDFALYRTDLPRVTSQVGALTVNYVADLEYTQYVVNGIPVDPATIAAANFDGLSVLTASAGRVEFGSPDQPRVPAGNTDGGRWTAGGSSKMGTVHAGMTPELLDTVVRTTVKQRMAKDLANEVGTVYQEVWREAHGMKPIDRHGAMVLGVYHDNPKAIAKMAKAFAEQAALAGSGGNTPFEPATPETVANVAAAMHELDANPVFQSVVDRYGKVQVAAVKNIYGLASGRYMSNWIAIAEIAAIPVHHWTGSEYVEMVGNSAPVKFDGLQVDSSLTGTIRHEYGHHVQSLLTTADDDIWRAGQNAWGKGQLGTTAMENEAISDNPDSGGISVYARTNGNEAFAETFAAVTHPDFNIANVPPAGRPLVDAMLKILKATP